MNKSKYIRLTTEDIEELRYQFRPALVFTLFILFAGAIGILCFIFINRPKPIPGVVIQYGMIMVIGLLLLAFLIRHLIIRKFKADILGGEKRVEVKVVKRKEALTDYEPGSGGYLNSEMKEFKRNNIIVENTRYTISSALYEQIDEGDGLLFHYGPKSGYLIRITKA